jgi:hypothetical protein
MQLDIYKTSSWDLDKPADQSLLVKAIFFRSGPAFFPGAARLFPSMIVQDAWW